MPNDARQATCIRWARVGQSGLDSEDHDKLDPTASPHGSEDQVPAMLLESS